MSLNGLGVVTACMPVSAARATFARCARVCMRRADLVVHCAIVVVVVAVAEEKQLLSESGAAVSNTTVLVPAEGSAAAAPPPSYEGARISLAVDG